MASNFQLQWKRCTGTHSDEGSCVAYTFGPILRLEFNRKGSRSTYNRFYINGFKFKSEEQLIAYLDNPKEYKKDISKKGN